MHVVCGRYALSKDPSALAVEFGTQEPAERLVPDYNIAPTKRSYIVVDRRSDADVLERSLEAARWGLVPRWAKDAGIGSRMANARAETVAEKPSFRSAFAKRRCLVPADGYYEWYLPSAAPVGTKPVKQPFFIHRADEHSLALAGLYEWWRDPGVPTEDPASWLLTFTIITTAATDDLARIHDRMPMSVAQGDWDAWLDPGVIGQDATALMSPRGSGELTAYPVATAVNSVRNNGATLIEPLAATS